ncbi:glycosyltransferase [Ameyamaea chiangmaiensis]|nr:glycosyltransferase [Ameyamaea chiangmaiensis]MBS4075796.1 glycosyltransferase [Ameyamaea chiangmaiensis]
MLPPPVSLPRRKDIDSDAALALERLGALYADDREDEVDLLERQMMLMRRSLSWRFTKPLRIVRTLLAGRLPGDRRLDQALATARAIVREQGAAPLLRRVARYYGFGRFVPSVLRRRLGLEGPRARPGSSGQDTTSAALVAAYRAPVSGTVGGMRPSILLIADMIIPQCVHYRVTQKRGALERLGWRVVVADWRNPVDALAEMQLCSQVVFYRVPAVDSALDLIREAHRLGLDPVWEIDDLLFDREAYMANRNLDTLSPEERYWLLTDAGRYREAMLACGRGLASTEGLAAGMRAAGLARVDVLENAFDASTIATAEAARSARPVSGADDRVWIVYGSGSRAHDADFACAADGIAQAMAAEPRLGLRIIGSLSLSDRFAAFGERVERLESVPFGPYLSALATADIAIAPLEATRFNDCKSAIKFLEASIVGVVCVCSPTDSFARIVQSGENGLLATGAAGWREAILTLAADPALRRQLADKARADVLARYAPDATERVVEAIFDRPPVFEPDGLRVMQANVFFAPRSYGGSTIVAEALTRVFVERGVTCSVITTRPQLPETPAAALRTVACGADVLGVQLRRKGMIDNPAVTADMARWLNSWGPGIVHIHAIQELGLGLLRACRERDIPYVVTLHDCWWLSDRLFLPRDEPAHRLVPLPGQAFEPPRSRHERYLQDRKRLMYQALMEAALIFSPSEDHRQRHIRNGIPADRIVVNRNGFRWPGRARRPRPPGAPLRFGYVGGPDWIKGFELIRGCVRALKSDAWELVLVDATLNLGFPTLDVDDWSVRGRVRVVPAFSQETMDDFYDQIDVLLFPSQWRESYGLTVREALARDVWVVVTEPGGQCEEIVEGVNGNRIAMDNRVATLQGAVERLLREAARFDAYVNPLKDRLMTYEAQADELLGWYEAILSRSGRDGWRSGEA